MEAISQMRLRDVNYHKYTRKIGEMVENGNLEQFSQEMIWNPNVVLSMMPQEMPLLYFLGKHHKKSIKLFKMFLGSMFHFESVFLDENGEFIKRYFNFQKTSSNVHMIEKQIFVKFAFVFYLLIVCLFVYLFLQLYELNSGALTLQI